MPFATIWNANGERINEKRIW